MTISPFEALFSLSAEFDFFMDVHEWPRLLFEKKLTPPVVVADGTPIWGFALMRRARDIGIPELPFREIPSAAKKDLLFIALSLENRGGEYSWNERLNIYSFCKNNGIAVDDALVEIIEENRFADWEQKVKQFEDFPVPLQQLVQEELLDFKSALRAAGLPGMCFSLIYDKKEKLTHSQRRIFLEQLHAVMVRDKISEKECSNLCADLLTDTDPMKKLELLRFPELSSMQKVFSDYAQTLRKNGITLSAPPYFEGEAFSLQFPFVSKSNYQKKLNALHDFESRIDELFRLL